MKILLLYNYRKQSTQLMTEKIAGFLAKQDIQTVTDDGHEPYSGQDVDFIIILGGDGTFLRAVRQYGQKNIPMLGVNMGTVGFLSNIHVDHIEAGLEKLLSGQYWLTEKMILQVKVFRSGECVHSLFGVNEVVVKSKLARIFTLSLSVEAKEIGLLRGDGVIVATPTGSTAYSLSAGGPIVDPDLSALVVTPLSSYYPHHRPFVMEASKVLEIEVLFGKENILCLDGQKNIDFYAHDRLTVCKAPVSLKLVNLEPSIFWSNIYKRLGRNLPV